MSEIPCDSNPTNPYCTCPEWGSRVGMSKVFIKQGEFGPNNPPSDRYFCSYSTSGCRGKPKDHQSCGCNQNSTYKDCNCKTGNKFLIPFGMYAHYRRDNIYCCGDQSGAFDNICRQTGWQPNTLENIQPSKSSTTTAAPSSIVLSTDQGKSVLSRTSQELESGTVFQQKETVVGEQPSEIIDMPAGVDQIKTLGTTISDPSSSSTVGVGPGSSVSPTSPILGNNNGTLAISTQPDNTIVVSKQAAPQPIINKNYSNDDEKISVTLIAAIISGILLFLLASFLFWKYS